jgi:DNA replication protein DnaC
MEEVSYVPDHTSIQANQLASLNSDQLKAFTTIVDAVLTNQPGFYFVAGYGGIGKTYLWKCIVNHLRAQKKLSLLLLPLV